MPESFGLYLILTDPVAGYERCAEAAVKLGVRYLQLRIKQGPRDEILRTARALREITRGSSTRFIVNDDVEIARDADADGVHVGQSDMSVVKVRELWPGRIVGLSTHDEAQEAAARSARPDYVGVGPLFPTPTKAIADPVLGPERGARIVRGSPLTTVAIGGIDASNLPALLRAGIVNFAVVRAVNKAARPAEAIAQLLDIWNATRTEAVAPLEA